MPPVRVTSSERPGRRPGSAVALACIITMLSTMSATSPCCRGRDFEGSTLLGTPAVSTRGRPAARRCVQRFTPFILDQAQALKAAIAGRARRCDPQSSAAGMPCRPPSNPTSAAPAVIAEDRYPSRARERAPRRGLAIAAPTARLLEHCCRFFATRTSGRSVPRRDDHGVCRSRHHRLIGNHPEILRHDRPAARVSRHTTCAQM